MLSRNDKVIYLSIYPEHLYKTFTVVLNVHMLRKKCFFLARCPVDVFLLNTVNFLSARVTKYCLMVPQTLSEREKRSSVQK